MKTKLTICTAILLLLLPSYFIAADEPKGVERFALYVGSNNGGNGREMLRYAGSDAMYLSKTMTEIGGITPSNSIILVDPLKDDINSALDALAMKITNASFSAKRTEFMFYYSGHSDENALLLGNDVYNYSQLKAAISAVPSDVHIVMLDSCFSGNFIRAKGGSRQKAFLQDDSSVVQGHAYLSSSSESESSQESDALQGSFFTNALVTGLRGAADTSGDNKVSLNELYYYAHNETLARTEKSTIGPQHPSYNITLVGSGDLILSDISSADSIVYLPAEADGRFFVRDAAGILVSEVQKTAGNRIALALEAGTYTILCLSGNEASQISITIEAGREYAVQSQSFYKVTRTSGRARGGEMQPGFINQEEPQPEMVTEPAMAQNSPVTQQVPPAGVQWSVFEFGFFEGIAFPMPKQPYVNMSIGLITASNENISGIQISSFRNTVKNSFNGTQLAGFSNRTECYAIGAQLSGFANVANGFRGFQSSGFMNITKTDSIGIQSSGFMNIAKGSFRGAQFSGFMNTIGSDFTGIQGSGFMNKASKSAIGLQAAGFMNIASESIRGCQIAGFMNIADSVTGAQIGLINVANQNTGVAIGLLNFISGGVMSPGVLFDQSGNVYVQYQGGTQYFFTTYLLGFGDETGMLMGFGLGTQLRLSKMISIDLEAFWKQILLYDAIDETQRILEEKDYKAASTDFAGIEYTTPGIPGIRGSLNIRLAKRFALTVTGSLDFEIKNFNEAGFITDYFGDATWRVSDRITAHPSWSVGIKL